MRVITGTAKGRKLQMVPGDSTRPITDRAKEALFSIIGDWIIETRVLDLFGGTGAVGIPLYLYRTAPIPKDVVQSIAPN